jgi:hypothetical protein
MAAIAEHCPGVVWNAQFNMASQRFTVSLTYRGRVTTEQFDPTNKDDELGVRYFLRTHQLGLPVRGLDDGIHSVLSSVEDDQVRGELIQTLITIRGRRAIPSALLHSNNIDIRRKVFEFRRHVADPTLQAELFNQIGAADEFYVELVGRLNLDASALAGLRSRLNTDAQTARQIACILAMNDTVEHVTELLTHPDWSVRGNAFDCTPYNARAGGIVAATPKAVLGFPIEGWTSLRQQVSRKEAFELELAKLSPELRHWRLEVTDATPGGFGFWGRGMRYWINEQLSVLSP